jgi:AcrR family transcriptional regulator
LEYIAESGVSEVSLRQVAQALGTSHRVLIYYFGSKQRLISEVVQLSVEEQLRRMDAVDHGDTRVTARSYGEALWRHVNDPRHEPLQVLYLELVALRIRRPDQARELFAGTAPGSMVQAFRRIGELADMPADVADSRGRIARAVMRGLTMYRLDLGVTERGELAWTRFLDSYDDWAVRQKVRGQDEPSPRDEIEAELTAAGVADEWPPGLSGSMAEQPSPADSAREDLIRRVIAYAVDHELLSMSLRDLAAALGTSHRMLIYYFGSKDALLDTVVERVSVQYGHSTLPEATKRLSPLAELWRLWSSSMRPEFARYLPLFFEIRVRGMRVRNASRATVADSQHRWAAQCEEICRRYGMPPEVAHGQAALMIGLASGLYVEWMTTGDRAAVDDLMSCFLDSFRDWKVANGDDGA